MTDLYILDENKVPVACNDQNTWYEFYHTMSNRRVGLDHVGRFRVSTVFLGINHNYGEGPPILFETMLFDGHDDLGMWRYKTWEEALAGHQATLQKARNMPECPFCSEIYADDVTINNLSIEKACPRHREICKQIMEQL